MLFCKSAALPQDTLLSLTNTLKYSFSSHLTFFPSFAFAQKNTMFLQESQNTGIVERAQCFSGNTRVLRAKTKALKYNFSPSTPCSFKSSVNSSQNVVYVAAHEDNPLAFYTFSTQCILVLPWRIHAMLSKILAKIQYWQIYYNILWIVKSICLCCNYKDLIK